MLGGDPSGPAEVRLSLRMYFSYCLVVGPLFGITWAIELW